MREIRMSGSMRGCRKRAVPLRACALLYQAVYGDLFHPTYREATRKLAQILFEPANHDVLQVALVDFHAPGRTFAGREFRAVLKNCWSVRCAAWLRGTGGARNEAPDPEWPA